MQIIRQNLLSVSIEIIFTVHISGGWITPNIILTEAIQIQIYQTTRSSNRIGLHQFKMYM